MNEIAYQAMPVVGSLSKNLNLSPEILLNKIEDFKDDKVYFYVVDTVEHEDGRLYQTGSGPNFQGDLITLCSCKHMMRTFLDVECWRGVWVAGYTSSRDLGSNRLFYLMRVSQAFRSHDDLWNSDSISTSTKKAKAAHKDRFGDLYRPDREIVRSYTSKHYVAPCENHVHCEPGDWHKDISYPPRHGRRPALLVGDPEFSFLWDRPLIRSPFRLTRGQRKKNLSDLLSQSDA